MVPPTWRRYKLYSRIFPYERSPDETVQMLLAVFIVTLHEHRISVWLKRGMAVAGRTTSGSLWRGAEVLNVRGARTFNGLKRFPAPFGGRH